MKFPKQVFKATWLVFSIAQVALIFLYFLNIGLVRMLLWWQLLTPLLWLAFWGTLWLLISLARSMWYSYLEAGRNGSRSVNRRKLLELRMELVNAERVDRMSTESRALRQQIRELEKSMAARQNHKEP